MTAAERFYESKYQLADQQGGPEQAKSPDEVLKELALPQQRYYCVYEYLRSHPNLSVLELGFGWAELAAAFSRLARTYHIVDVVDRRGETILPDNVPFTKADLNDDFPFSDGQFDCVVAMMVVEHLFDPFHSFSEISRVTKPGGKVFLNLPNIASIRCRWELLQGKMPVTSAHNWFDKSEWDGNHLHYFTIADTKRIAEKFGLTLEAIYPVGSQLWLKKLNPGLFCHEISFVFSK